MLPFNSNALRATMKQVARSTFSDVPGIRMLGKGPRIGIVLGLTFPGEDNVPVIWRWLEQNQDRIADGASIACVSARVPYNAPVDGRPNRIPDGPRDLAFSQYLRVAQITEAFAERQVVLGIDISHGPREGRLIQGVSGGGINCFAAVRLVGLPEAELAATQMHSVLGAALPNIPICEVACDPDQTSTLTAGLSSLASVGLLQGPMDSVAHTQLVYQIRGTVMGDRRRKYQLVPKLAEGERQVEVGDPIATGDDNSTLTASAAGTLFLLQIDQLLDPIAYIAERIGDNTAGFQIPQGI